MSGAPLTVRRPRPPRQPMPHQAAAARVTNFCEVALGLTPELAQAEAERCLLCRKPLCVEGCPVGIDIPGFIARMVKGDFEGAARTLREATDLPAVCGRVCPQETQCEKVCVVGRKGEPVAIGRLERFVGDWARTESSAPPPSLPMTRPERVAIVGSGPAGIAAAGELLRRGYRVTIFEALHEPGGVLMYGIPEFRLPKEIVRYEIQQLRRLGAEIRTNALVGQTVTVEELLGEGFGAVFLGTGAGLPILLGVPGEHLNGVYSANEFLIRINLMKAHDFPRHHTPVFVGRRVVVVGGGNTAMDAARVARRLGPEKVCVVYRRSRAEMPARAEEIAHGLEEGIEFFLLTAPVKLLDRGDGWVRGMECVRMELGEPDASGRRRPHPIAGSHFVLDAETVIVALGNNPNRIVPETTAGLDVTPRGTIEVDVDGATTKLGVFAGGDNVTGGATVILAMGAGKRAAAAMDEYLRGQRDGRAVAKATRVGIEEN
ncbi:MAG: NADPH-dependent glutamate synthase [Verrucomicrobiae bacterium]|nr:NADPH-dependent glutamate synthase [Verrucomicrobiae bacterium]